jgi:chromosomal replication initiator protein
MVADFEVGDENSGLRYLFEDDTIRDLSSLSPVVFFGEDGTGKTALSLTLAVRWARLTLARPLCFSSGESFAQDYAAAIEIDDLESFHSRYRQCKLLIIDSLERLSEKAAAQDELVSTLDVLAKLQAPVIVSCNKLPASVRRMKPALASRLSAGFSIELSRPGKETRRALVASLIQAIDRSLPTEQICDFCSELDRPSAYDLKSVVTIAHQSKTSSGSVDFDVMSQLVRQHLSGTHLSVPEIAKVVARRLRVKLSDMRGSTRHANIVRARGLAILLSRNLTSASLQQIGHYFGDRDHSTILHAFRKTNRLLSSDAELSKALADAHSELIAR